MSKSDDLRLGATVKQFREEAKLSQAQLAARMTQEGAEGIYPQTIMKIESGDRKLRFLEAAALARALGISVQDLDAGSAAASRTNRHVRTLIDELEEAVRKFDVALTHLVLTRSNLGAALVVGVNDGHPEWAASAELRELAQGALLYSQLDRILEANTFVGSREARQ